MNGTYKNLIVWQKASELAVEVYFVTKNFPKEELYGITSQMRRAAVSIPSNIAEGKLRGFDKECKRFFLIAYGSGGELETQIHIAKKIFPNDRLDFSKIDSLLSEVMKMLNVLISRTENELNPKL